MNIQAIVRKYITDEEVTLFNTSPALIDALYEIDVCRDMDRGRQSIVEGGYIKPLYSGDTASFNAFIELGEFIPALSRTISGALGKCFAVNRNDGQKNSVFSYLNKDHEPVNFDALQLKNIDSLFSLGGIAPHAKKAMGLVLRDGRCGILLSGKDAKFYPIIYSTDNIINWRKNRLTGVLEKVLLREHIYNDEDKLECLYRELSLKDGVYTIITKKAQQKTENKSDGDEVVIVSTVTPTYKGNTLDKIPFFIISPLTNDIDDVKPPMVSLARLSIHYYESSCCLRNANRHTGSPTIVVKSDNKISNVTVGTEKGIHVDTNADVYYLEYKGQGVESIRDSMKENKNSMEALGASFLNVNTKNVESGETHKLRLQNYDLSLLNLLQNLTSVYSEVLTYLHIYNDLPYEKGIYITHKLVSGEEEEEEKQLDTTTE